MKKAMTIVCVLVQTLIIALANLFAIAMVMNCYADAIGYYGWLNIPMFIVVAVIVCATLVVWMKEIVRNR